MNVQQAKNALGLTALVSAAIASAVLAWRMDWISDDAFVSFRCARNLVQGRGLVFNEGEYVESYSNFLWTLLLAGGVGAGIDSSDSARIMGVASLVATVLLLGWAEWRMRPRHSPFVPIAAGAWALLGHAQSFAVSGLETVFFTALVSATLVMTVEASTHRGFVWAGTLAALAALTRPDGALLLVPLGWVALQATSTLDHRRVVVSAIGPVVAIHLPYVIWKAWYYGHVIPNTFFAKGAYSPYPSQGVVYLGLFLASYYVLIAAVAVAAVSIWKDRRSSLAGAGWTGQRPAFVLGGFAFLFMAYVAWIGGDFMFARFCLPLAPALLLFLSTFLVQHLRGWPYLLCGVAVVAGIAFPWPVAKLNEGRMFAGVVEERLYNTQSRLGSVQEVAQFLAESTRGTDPRILVGGGMMALAYYGDFPFVIDSYGLTDAAIARRPLSARGRIGHEKELGVYSPYFAWRGIDFAVPLNVIPPIAPDDPLAPFRLMTFEVPSQHSGKSLLPGNRIPVILLSYRRSVMSVLAERAGVEFVPLEPHLDRFIRELPQMDPNSVRTEYGALLDFYFRHNQDPERQAAIEQYLAKQSNR